MAAAPATSQMLVMTRPMGKIMICTPGSTKAMVSLAGSVPVVEGGQLVDDVVDGYLGKGKLRQHDVLAEDASDEDGFVGRHVGGDGPGRRC